MRFIENFKKSIYDVAWLRQQKAEPKKAWRYFLALLAVLVAVTTLPLLVSLPKAARSVREQIGSIPDFKATLRDGSLTITGLSEPAVFKQSDNVTVVVNTSAAASTSLDKFLEKPGESGLLVARDRIEILDGSSGERRIQYWKGMPDYALTKIQLLENVDKYLRPGYLALFAIIILVAAYLAAVAAQLVSILVVSAIVLLAAKFRKYTWRFGELFTVGLFAVTLPTIIAALLTLIGLGTPSLHFLALLAFMLAVVFTKDKDKEVVVNPDVSGM